MNTLTTYFYKGDFAQDLTSTSITVNAVTYWTLVAEVVVFYGAYNGSDTVPSVQPQNLPPITNVALNASFYRYDGGPTSRYAAAKLVNITPIFEADDLRNCLGTKYTFVSPVVAPDDCANDYCLVWSTNRIEMPYGPDMIFIGAQNGVTAPESLC